MQDRAPSKFSDSIYKGVVLFFMLSIVWASMVALFSLTRGKVFLFNSITMNINILYAVGFLLIYAPAAYFLPKGIKSNFLLSFLAFILFVFFKAQSGLGDDWGYQVAVQKDLWASEIFGSLVMKFLFYLNRNFIFHIYSPVLGAISIWIFLQMMESILRPAQGEVLLRLAPMLTGINLIYFGRYLEVTALSVPFTLLFTWSLYLYWNVTNDRIKFLVLSSVFITLSMFVHLGTMVFLPAVFILAALRPVKTALRDFIYVFLSILMVCAGALLIIKIFGFSVIQGNVHQGTLKVTSWSALSSSIKYGNISQIMNIYFIAVPLAFAALVIAVKSWSILKIRTEWLPIFLIAAAGLSFVPMVNFYFGFPKDWDLMSYNLYVAHLLSVFLICVFLPEKYRFLMSVTFLFVFIWVFSFCAQWLSPILHI